MPNCIGLIDDGDVDQTFSCYAAGSLFIVGCDGKISLCEYDWRKTVDLGDIYKDSLVDIFKKKRSLNDELDVKGNKNATEVCQLCSRQFRRNMQIHPYVQKLSDSLGCQLNELIGSIRNNYTDADVRKISFLGRRFSSYLECIDTLEELYEAMGSLNAHQVYFLFAIPSKDPIPMQHKKQLPPRDGDVPVYLVHATKIRDSWPKLIKDYLGADLEDYSDNVKLLRWNNADASKV